MTLTKFLLMRITEDYSAARAAVLRSSDGADDRWVQSWGNASTRSLGSPVAVGALDGNMGNAARHVVRWDPARVMDECEAKYLTVAVCAAAGTQPGIAPEGAKQGAAEAIACRHGEQVPADAILRALATAYCDHPDYREEWGS